jgi:hypothetical protein
MRPPFKTEHAPAKPGQAEKWLKALDDFGVENVRIRLAQSDSKPNDAFYRLGSDIAVSRGFAEDWLSFHNRHSRAVERRWRWAIFIPACISAVVSCGAALAVLAPHLSRALNHVHTSDSKQILPASVALAPGSTWHAVAVDEYITVNGNIFQAECGPKPESIQRIDTPDVVRFQMIAGNRWYNDTGDERTELDGYRQPFQVGKPYWAAYALYIEPGSRMTADWIALGQIPGLMGHFVKNMIMTWSAAGKNFHSERIEQGISYQFVEKFIVDPVNGYYGSWFNGKQVVDYHGPFGAVGKTYYPKFGIYRGAAPETMTVRYANYKFGTAGLSELIANPDPVPAMLPWP